MLRVRVCERDFGGYFAIYVVDTREDVQGWPHHEVAKPVEMDKRELGEPVDPTFSLDDRGCQALMDDLWRCGFRPTEGKGSAGALKATEYHLEDMRRLVFEKGTE